MCYATQLTNLSLSWIRLPEGDLINTELHLVCPVLKTFRMISCCSNHLRVLNISAPRLNTLSIYNDFVRYDGLGGCRIEIRTPNLTSLAYSGYVYVDCFMENLPRIVNASLIIPKGTANQASFATKFLKGLNNAKCLTLGVFEVFSQDTLKVLLTSFSSIKTLKLITTCEISSIHGMVHILNNCNSVENLVWFASKICVEEGDEHLMLPQCKLSYLKHVHIKSLHGHNNEIDMVKFLLKSSVVLEDLIINLSIKSSKRSIEENLAQFIEEEPSLGSIRLHIL